jgi:hypothetical protein
MKPSPLIEIERAFSPYVRGLPVEWGKCSEEEQKRCGERI